MKLAIMQPYFFPYLGYFDLINQADEWIVFDTPQYMRHQWVNRNRILHPNAGWQYIVVPLKSHHQTTPINQIEIANNVNWQVRILGQLQHYKKDAPFYAQVMGFLEECFSNSDANLARFNTETFRKTCFYLGIDKPIRVFSEMNLPIERVSKPEDWGWKIAQAVGASEYVNPPGGAAFLDEANYLEHGIKLTIQSFTNMRYACGRYQFEPALSIIDVMMWNSPEEIKRYLDTFRLKTEMSDE